MKDTSSSSNAGLEFNRQAMLQIRDLPPDQALDELAFLASELCQTPFAFISVVDSDHVWVKAKVGGEAFKDMPLDLSFCAYTIQQEDVLEVADALQDNRFRLSPLVVNEPHIRFYAGAPLVMEDGQIIGALCVLDRVPRQLTADQKRSLRLVSRRIVARLGKNLVRWNQRKSEEHIRAIVDSSDDAIISETLDGVITSWNPAAERIFGYASQEAVGQSVSIIIPSEGFEAELRILERIGKAESIEPFETMRQTRDGERLLVSVRVSPVRDSLGRVIGASKILRDLSEKKKFDSRMADVEFRLRAQEYALNQSCIVALTDLNGNITFANEKFCEISKYQRGELLGQNHRILNSGYHSKEFFKSMWQTIGSGKVWRGELKNRAKDGSFYWVDSTIVPICDSNGKPSNYISIRYEITDRKRFEEELRESTARFQLLADQAPVLIWMSGPDKLFTYFNKGWLDFTGRAFDDERGLGWIEGVHPDDRGTVSRIYQISFDARKEFKIEYRLRRSDGVFRWVLVHGTPRFFSEGRFEGYIGSCVDVDDQRQSESEVRIAKDRLWETNQMQQAILDAANYSVISTDAKGIIRTFNKTAEGFLGYRAEEMINNRTPSIVHDRREIVARAEVLSKELGRRVEPGFEALVAKARLGTPDENEWTYIRKDGSKFPVLLSVTALFDKENEITGFLAVAGDLTERKKVEKMKNEFISTVSHELRTPLTSIRGVLGLLSGGLGGEVSSKGKSLIEMGVKNADRLVRLINDILDIEKMESGKMSFNLASVDLVALSKQVLEAIEPFATSFRVKLFFGSKLDSAWVHADSDRVTQVLTNLISNAVKFSPADAVVRVAIERSDRFIQVSVDDRGRGIPEEFQNKIFQKFAQADASDSRQKGGTGLGLSISKMMIEQQGGTIWFQSKRNEGTTFYFQFPELSERISLESFRKSGVVSGRILICEDDPDVGALLKMMLESSGFQCELAASVKDALYKLNTEEFDAMTLDLALPDQDGISFVRDLRSTRRWKNLPIIVVSAKADQGRKELNGATFSIVDWITKPIDRDRLIGALNCALGVGLKTSRILHVEDDPDTLVLLPNIANIDAVWDHAICLKDAASLLEKLVYDLVILDLMLPDGSGWDLLSLINQQVNPPPVLVFSALETTLSSDLAKKVKAILVKSKTSNDELSATVCRLLDSEVKRVDMVYNLSRQSSR